MILFRHTTTAVVIVIAATASACKSSSTGDGNLQVHLGAEETIPEGLRSGSGEEDIRDGFNVSFDDYIISIGRVRMSMRDQDELLDDSVRVVGLVDLPTSGLVLSEFVGIPTGQYDQFGFETPVPTAESIKAANVSQDDFDEMVEQGWSYLIRGVLSDDGGTPNDASDDGQVVDVRFEIGADVPSIYSDCGVEDAQMLGVNVASSSSAEITIHGDHIFFNGFPTEEGTITRLAAWMAMVDDIDEDGVLTQLDFEAANDLGALFPSPPGGQYELTGGPLAVNNAWDFIRAQLGTQGHIMGEGECDWNNL